MRDLIFFINLKFGTFAKYSHDHTYFHNIGFAKVITYERIFKRDRPLSFK